MHPGKWVQEPSRGWTIYVKIILGSGSELGGVRVWRARPFFIQILELRFNRQIFMIFIVGYIFFVSHNYIFVFKVRISSPLQT